MTRELFVRCRRHILGTVAHNRKQTKEKLYLIDAITAELTKPQGEPAWHDAPTVPGLWFLRHAAGVEAHMIEQEHLGETMIGDWYGPIPEDKQ